MASRGEKFLAWVAHSGPPWASSTPTKPMEPASRVGRPFAARSRRCPMYWSRPGVMLTWIPFTSLTGGISDQRRPPVMARPGRTRQVSWK